MVSPLGTRLSRPCININIKGTLCATGILCEVRSCSWRGRAVGHHAPCGAAPARPSLLRRSACAPAPCTRQTHEGLMVQGEHAHMLCGVKRLRLSCEGSSGRVAAALAIACLARHSLLSSSVMSLHPFFAACCMFATFALQSSCGLHGPFCNLSSRRDSHVPSVVCTRLWFDTMFRASWWCRLGGRLGRPSTRDATA